MVPRAVIVFGVALSLVIGLQEVKRVPFPDPEFVKVLSKDPDVVDWQLTVSDKEAVREIYIDWLARFLQWTEWSVEEMFAIKKKALKEGETKSLVETQIKRFHETLRLQGLAGKTRAQAISAIRTFIDVKGYPLPRRLVKLDLTNEKETRHLEDPEINLFLEYARGVRNKLLYTLMRDTPCRPRVFTMLRWSWLEQEWWKKDVVHVSLPKALRPSTQSTSRKFEPICFLGPRTISLLQQFRESLLHQGKVPLETDQVLEISGDGLRATVKRDYQTLVDLKLIRPSRKNETGKRTEQRISPKTWRKYGFNIIDSLTDISPEYRQMLKGRDLDTEKYYSRENVEKLREIYRTRIYPQLWQDTRTPRNPADLWATLKLAAKQDPKGLQEFLEFTKGLNVKA